MAQPFEVRENLSQEEFVSEYIAKNKPVVVSGIPFEADNWHPDNLKNRIGEETTQIYDTLFDLENVTSLEEYLDDYFGTEGPMPTDVPYVRWYNQLKDVDFVWGDEALASLANYWKRPSCVPADGMIVPVTSATASADPVSDNFPYRGLLVAARGARTRMHRDPFCSDAIVAQFYGTKEAALYHPDRTAELTVRDDDNSFGGFVDVREDNIEALSIEPDFHGTIEPGQMVYIPHGWLHEVLCLTDSISVTWNFVHRQGASEFVEYLKADPTDDSEFEVLQYFFQRAGLGELSAPEILSRVT